MMAKNELKKEGKKRFSHTPLPGGIMQIDESDFRGARSPAYNEKFVYFPVYTA